MKFQLRPPSDRPPLHYLRLLERLRSEFGDFIHIDDQSEEDVDGMVAELIELDAPAQMIEEARTGLLLRVFIHDFDYSDDYVSFDLTPVTTTLSGHYPDHDTGSVLHILERCANALQYNLDIN